MSEMCEDVIKNQETVIEVQEDVIDRLDGCSDLGVCAFCGQSYIITKPAESLEEANQRATDICNCPGSKDYRRQRQERKTIEEMFGQFGPEVRDYLYETAQMMRVGLLQNGTTLKLEENISAKFKVKEGAVTITRSVKIENKRSI